MKLRTFFGLTSRSVLDQVRTELGPDAMIVSNRATADGIEVTAVAAGAIDTLLREPAPPVERGPSEAATPSMAAASGGEVKSWRPAAAKPAASSEPIAAVAAPTNAPAETIPARLMEEIAAMRALISEQLAQLAWNDSLRRQPLKARMVRDLIAAGYSARLARELTGRVPDDFSSTQAIQWLTRTLARELTCVAAADDIVTRGGVFALVGPTGVGKTTTTAKLAARCAVRYGSGKVALLTTDTFRVGAQDQLRIYARILGLAVHTVSDRHDFRQALDAVRGRHLVLIDTVGMGQRDTRVAEQSLLLSQPGVQRILLLNATAQAETLDEVVASYGHAPERVEGTAIAGVIVTKIDEAVKTGPVLDVAIRHRLALHFIANGQRVPEDLYTPNPDYLVHRSLRIGTRPTPHTLGDDEFALAMAPIAKAGHA
jgi:flagellar biosynthesis protein FlhF